MSLWYGHIRTFVLEVFIQDLRQDVTNTNLLAQKISSVGLCQKIFYSNTLSCNKYSPREKFFFYLPAMSQYRSDHHQQQTFLTGRFPRGINSGRSGFPNTLLLSAFTLDIKRMLYSFVLDVSVIESACADRFKFHLDTPSSMYIWVCNALHLHPDETKNRITDYNKLQQYYVNIQ